MATNKVDLAGKTYAKFVTSRALDNAQFLRGFAACKGGINKHIAAFRQPEWRALYGAHRTYTEDGETRKTGERS